MLRLSLNEYASRPFELSPLVAEELAATDPRVLDVSLSGTEGRYRLTASSYVGAVVTSRAAVLIRPKVPLHNLFVMLGVAPPEFTGSPFSYDSDMGILSVMAAVFARAVDRATMRGVVRGYRHTEERLVSPRGRIDITEQMRRPGLPTPIDCRFDEFTADVFQNRVLVAAIARLRRVPRLSPELRVQLNRLGLRFEEVAGVPIDPAAVDRWQPGRLDLHYEQAMRLATVILRNLTLADEHGSTSAASFTVDMNDLFQRFVTDRLRRATPRPLKLVAEPPIRFAYGSGMRLRPDLTFKERGRNAYVGDVKYKLSSGPARMHDYQQLLTYTTVIGLDDGVLVYAQDPDDEHPLEGVHEVRVVNTDTTLVTYRLVLTGSPAELEAELAKLAEWIRDRARRPASAHAA